MTSYPKSDVRYWRARLEKRGTEDFHARIGFEGRQERFPLKTANAEDAAAKARDIYMSLHRVGWTATKDKFKPWRSKWDPSQEVTVGDYIKAARAVSTIRPSSFQTYERKFRFLVAELTKLKSTKAKFDRRKGAVRFRKKVDGIPLASITAKAVTRWHVDYLSRHDENPIIQNRARQSAASTIRNSRSLFSSKITKHLGIPLPNPLPLAGVSIGKLPRTRYRSAINLPLLVKLANDELRGSKPELFKVFLLAAGAGLRRSEIDSLTWPQFDWTNGRLTIEANEYGQTKTEHSSDAIDIGPEMAGVFKDYLRESVGPFVVSSAVAPMPAAHWKHYRCERQFVELIYWLRSKGVEDLHPLHALRKEFGSAINQKFGIFAASSALRHSSITLTREHYVDKKERIALDLPELLEGGAA